jgi:hypothetical protein
MRAFVSRRFAVKQTLFAVSSVLACTGVAACSGADASTEPEPPVEATAQADTASNTWFFASNNVSNPKPATGSTPGTFDGADAVGVEIITSSSSPSGYAVRLFFCGVAIANLDSHTRWFKGPLAYDGGMKFHADVIDTADNNLSTHVDFDFNGRFDAWKAGGTILFDDQTTATWSAPFISANSKVTGLFENDGFTPTHHAGLIYTPSFSAGAMILAPKELGTEIVVPIEKPTADGTVEASYGKTPTTVQTPITLTPVKALP